MKMWWLIVIETPDYGGIVPGVESSTSPSEQPERTGIACNNVKSLGTLTLSPNKGDKAIPGYYCNPRDCTVPLD